MAERVKVVAKIADTEHRGRVRLERGAVPRRARRSAVVPCFGSRSRRRTSRASCSRRPTTSYEQTTSRQLVLDADQDVLPQLAHGRLAVRALEEPDARTTCSRSPRWSRRRRRCPAERALDRRRDLQPAAQPDAARDRRDAPLRAAHPADEVDHRVASSRARTRTTRARFYGLPPTPIANPGLASLRAAAHPAQRRLPLLRAQARPQAPLLHRERIGVRRSTSPTHGLQVTTHVALLGHPVSHSLSPRMQNAAFAAAGLDWHYAAFDVEDPVAAVAALRDARLRRRERDDPAQAGGRRRLRRGRRRGGEHARLPRRPRDRLQHRQGDPRRDLGDARLPDRRRRRGADARARRFRPTRGSSRRQRRLAAGRDRLRPDRERDARCATSCSSSRTPGQTVVELAYSPDGADTALVAAARAAGCEVIDGLEALVRQGAKSFELWTGIPAPVGVMRDAVRIPV